MLSEERKHKLKLNLFLNLESDEKSGKDSLNALFMYAIELSLLKTQTASEKLFKIILLFILITEINKND